MIWIGVSALLLAALLVWLERRKTRRTMRRIEQMLDAAMDGSFVESSFDESKLSSLEARFAQYLSSSEISARNVAHEKDKIKSLIADISHQTKTPIANLLLYSELLDEETLGEEAGSNVKAIHQQTEKLRFLIDALVKLSRLENGIIALSVACNPVFPMLESIVRQYTPKALEKGLQIRINPTEETAVFDPKWTAEAISNIVDNAVKYTDTGEICISVIKYEMFVRVDISDSGIGISESEQARIFSRFYRSENVSEREGVGIGLYLARQIITEEGGYMKVSSALGKGSTFSVFLPR